MKRIHILTLAAILSLLPSCSLLDFGGDDEKQWEFQFFWDQGPQIGEEDEDNPGFDKDGNKIPPPEVLATYLFPDVSAGYAWLDGDDPKITGTLNIEIAEFKVPYLRWFSIQAGAGSNEAHIYVGKRLTSIVEVTIGPMLARRFDEDDWVLGIQATLIKF